MILTAYSDGGCRKKTNVAGYAAIITYLDGNKVTIAEATDYMTNNEAEYLGLLTALEYAVGKRAEVLQMRMDSELIVRQIDGTYAARDPRMREFRQRSLKLIERIPTFSIKHVYREHNKEADAAVNAVIDQRLRARKK